MNIFSFKYVVGLVAVLGIAIAFNNCGSVFNSQVSFSSYEKQVFSEGDTFANYTDDSVNLDFDSNGNPTLITPTGPDLGIGENDSNEFYPSDLIVCPQTTGVNVSGPTGSTENSYCPYGYEWNTSQSTCQRICTDSNVYVNAQCIPRIADCNMEGGLGKKVWAGNTYLSCEAKSCEEAKGYFLDVENKVCLNKCNLNTEAYFEGRCEKLIMPCKVTHGQGITKWLETTRTQCLDLKCDYGFKVEGDSCKAICTSDQLYVDNKCIPKVKNCTVDGGVGQSTWVDGAYSACEVTKCDVGRTQVGNLCHVTACTLAGGVGLRTWANGKDGLCEATSCFKDKGFVLENKNCVNACTSNQDFIDGKCMPKEQACPISHGTGIQYLSGSTYSACAPTSCENGYKQLFNQCVSVNCPISGGVGQPVVESGKIICKPTSCNTDQGFVMKGDSCVQSCDTSKQIYSVSAKSCVQLVTSCPVSNGVGVKQWSGDQTGNYGACDLTCNPGYKKVGSSCVSTCTSSQTLHNGQCVPLITSCPVANGTGRQTWNTAKSSYSACTAVSCNSQFELSGGWCRERERSDRDSDPLIIDLGADAGQKGIELTSQLKGILFDILGLRSTPIAHEEKMISWTSNSRYRFLTLPNKSGKVEGIEELLGDSTTGPDGEFALDGFATLAKYDGLNENLILNEANKDNVIDKKDAVFSKLRLWHDANGDGKSSDSELTSLESAGIISIDLAYDDRYYEIDRFGNRTIFKSTVHFADGKKALIFDLWFRFFEKIRPGCQKITIQSIKQ